MFNQKTAASETLLIIACVIVLFKSVDSARTWNTLFMDDEDNCGQMVVTNDDLEEGDSYIVRSDSWQGRSTWSRKPAECTIGINLGDRMVGVNLIEWWCDKVYKEPFLDIYDNCDGTRKNLLAHYNCSNARPVKLSSTGTCVSLYHYRGHTRSGYFFSVELMATYGLLQLQDYVNHWREQALAPATRALRQRHWITYTRFCDNYKLKPIPCDIFQASSYIAYLEVIAFPAGGIAALILASIVGTMLVVKIVCVATGYENKIPAIPIDPEEPKQTLLHLDLGGSHKEFLQETSLQVPGATCSEIEATSGVAESSLQTPGGAGAGAAAHHSLLERTHSSFTPLNGTPSHDCWDSDGMETYSPPKLKRYCSVRASRILRL